MKYNRVNFRGYNDSQKDSTSCLTVLLEQQVCSKDKLYAIPLNTNPDDSTCIMQWNHGYFKILLDPLMESSSGA